MKTHIYIRHILLPAYIAAYILISFVVEAQNSEVIPVKIIKRIDTLKSLIGNQTLAEREQMEIYGQLTEYYASFDPDSVIVYAPKVIGLAEKLNETAIAQYNYCHLGTAYCFKANYDTSLFYLEKAEQLAKAMNDKYAESKAIGQIGFLYASQGKYISAIDTYLRALAILENQNYTVNRIFVLASLGELHRKLGNTDVALTYLDEAATLCNGLTGFLYNWRISKIYNEYATIYLSNGELEKALGYVLLSDSIYGSVIDNCIAKVLLSEIYLRLEDYERALQYADEAMTYANVLKSDNLHVNILNVLSNIYFAQQRYPEAEAEAFKIWRIDSTNVNESRIAAANIARANIHMQNAVKAADFFIKHIALNEQYSEKSFHTTVSDLHIKYNVDKKEIRLLSIKRQTLLYITIGIAGIIFAIVGWIIFRLRMRKEQLQKQFLAAQVVFESENKERERAALYIQNGLVRIISEAIDELDELDDSAEYTPTVRNKLDELSEEIHSIVTGIRPALLNRLGIKTSLENYCRKFPIVRFQFSGSDNRLDIKMEDAIYYCARELVNNSVKHSGATAVNVRLIQNNDSILLTVGDNGRGLDKDFTGGGSGLKNIYHRIVALKGFVDILSSPGMGTEATIRVNISTH